MLNLANILDGAPEFRVELMIGHLVIAHSVCNFFEYDTCPAARDVERM